MARAITADELTLLRTAGQYAELFLAIHKPATVYSARVNQTFTTTDGIAEITYDGGSGTLANVLPGMTLYVGTSAGAYDKGMVRVRKAPSGTKFYIGETSEIFWEDNDYLTVVDEFGLWAKHPVTPDETTIYYDYDIAYSDQHATPDPVPVLGPPAITWLTGATVDVAFDGSLSWVLGGTITGFAWSAPGAAVTAGMDTATPTVTYNAPGTYRVSCTLTASNGKTFTGYRYVFVFSAASMPATAFQLDTCRGEWESGGWEYAVTMWDQASLTDIRDRAMVILFAKDTYGAAQQSIGPIAGREKVIAVGWINGESITQHPELGSVEFTVKGPNWWMDQMMAYPVGMRSVATAPTNWKEFQDLTIDKGLWHLLHWRTTATLMMDMFLTGDTRPAYSVEALFDTLWKQLDTLAYQSILAKPLCDRYGRLFIEPDAQIVPVADRASIPVVQELYSHDWQGAVDIERRPLPPVSRLDISGWVCADFANPKVIFSSANGIVVRRFGKVESRDNLLLADQDQANALAGLIMGWMNNRFPRLSFALASNHRMIDICPRQYCQVDFAAEDTLRGFVCSNQKLIPRAVEFSHDPESGTLLTEVDFEGETTAEIAVTVTRPQTPDINIPDGPGIVVPDWPIIPVIKPKIYPPPPVIPTDPDAPGEPCRDGTDTSENGPWNLWVSGTLNSVSPSSHFIPYHVYARPGSSPNPTRYVIDAAFQKLVSGSWVADDGNDEYDVYAVDCNGSRIATGVHDLNSGSLRGGYFNLPAGTEICGIEIVNRPEAFGFVDATMDANLFTTIWHNTEEYGAFTYQGFGTHALGVIGVTSANVTTFGTDIRQRIGFHFDTPGPRPVRVVGSAAQNAQGGQGATAWTVDSDIPGEHETGTGTTCEVTLLADDFVSVQFETAFSAGIRGEQSMVAEVFAVATRKMNIRSANLWNICAP
jgi:hypothetical protein